MLIFFLIMATTTNLLDILKKFLVCSYNTQKVRKLLFRCAVDKQMIERFLREKSVVDLILIEATRYNTRITSGLTLSQV